MKHFKPTSVQIDYDVSSGYAVFVDGNYMHRDNPDCYLRKEDAWKIIDMLIRFYSEVDDFAIVEMHAKSSQTEKMLKAQFGFVYLFKRDDGLVKIGVTGNATNKRRYQVERMVKQKVVVVAEKWSKTPYFHEARLHDLYCDKRIEGEWFELSEADVQDIIRREGFEVAS